MASVYDRTDIYDLLENEDRYQTIKRHWEKLLEGKQVHTLLDVSIGTGNLTLPLAEMGVTLYGSDLSRAMLEKCGENAVKRGIHVHFCEDSCAEKRLSGQHVGCAAGAGEDPLCPAHASGKVCGSSQEGGADTQEGKKRGTLTLKACDFREAGAHFQEKFDCVASTGNSLPHVDNEDVLKTLEQMDLLVKPGGYLCYDMRNWDRILEERNRFYLYNPVFHEDMRINMIQVWDYHGDGSMTFNLLYTFERENRIFRREKFAEHYFPVKRELLLEKLRSLGYGEIKVMCHPACFDVKALEAEWYCVMAQKRAWPPLHHTIFRMESTDR